MNDTILNLNGKKQDRKKFLQSLLQDLEALQYMLDNDYFRDKTVRIGAEQELDLVDQEFHPAPVALKLLENLDRKHFTTEYALFNLEINSSPRELHHNCFSAMGAELQQRIEEVERAADKFKVKAVLTGILPTLRERHLTLEMLTPTPRYQTLVHIVNQRRGANYEFHIKGVDELITRHNPGVFGGAFTSFQVHLQVHPGEIVDKYNWAQALSGPVLAMSANSPLFLGKRLWQETRVALFQQTTDTRKPYSNHKEEQARVSMGSDWVRESIMEVYQNHISRYPALIAIECRENSREEIEAGRIPELEALQFYNGTIYPWNRLCYGITKGEPHLRIENRIFPAGPTIDDQLANAAFWIGLMQGMPDEVKNLPDKMSYSTAINNFQKAARYGMEVEFEWLDGKQCSARELLEDLLPVAREGLLRSHVSEEEVNYFLGIVANRISSKKTGAKWIFDNYDRLLKDYSKDEALTTVTSGLYARQKRGKPVHTWDDTSFAENRTGFSGNSGVEKIMTTNIIAVNENDPLKLAANIFVWKQINHLPVENDAGLLVGLLSKRKLFDLLFEKNSDWNDFSVKEVMQTEFVKLQGNATILDAIKIMLDSRITCLPVVENGILSGLVTQHDFVKFSSHLMEKINGGKLNFKENEDDG